MVLSAPPPPRKLVEASFSLLLAEEEKRRKAFASVEEAELVRHNARKAQIEQESQQQRAACLAAANGQQLTKPVEDLLNNSRAMLLDKEDEEFKRGILERKKAFEEKERDAPLPRRQKTASRTITFDEVYCNGKPEYKHMIDEWPKKSGCFYMFRCDEHMVHFNKNAIHGAAKHLHSQQHGYMQKGYETAVNVLGYRIPDCTHELAEKNNKMVKEAFEKGYKPLNANHMTKLDRQAYELKHGVFLESRVESTAPSFPNLKNWEAKTSRAPVNTDIPAIGDLYRVYWREDLKTYLVMILPWKGTLEVCGLPHKSLFDPPAYGPKPPNKRRDRVVMASAPPCYVSDRQTGQIVDWAPGFEDGGARVSEREFPVMFFDEGRNFGWVPLRELLPFSFSKPSHRKTPYFNDAADHVAKIRGFTSFEQMMAVADGRDPKTSKSTLLPHLRPPSQPQATTGVHDDVEMTDSPSSEAPSFSGPNLGALTAHLSLSDRRDSNKSDSSSVAMDEDDAFDGGRSNSGAR
ncbi:hypothetical protein QBC39DRAFT_377711 [Podospora conica]|nr:hypothetical protein QBC39DRAFT_377711 [Schizothecium conicum]